MPDERELQTNKPPSPPTPAFPEAPSLDDLMKELEDKYADKELHDAWVTEAGSWRQILPTITSGDGGIGFNYQLEKVLGMGGAGVVFLVFDKNLYASFSPEDERTEEEARRDRSRRALKVPRPHLEKGPSLADSLREEISYLVSLSHPHIVNLYAKGQVSVQFRGKSEDWPWYVMSFIPNAKDLQKVCDEIRPPPLPELITYLDQISQGLAYVHSVGIVHCDVKPANIFVAKGGALLADFGYSKRPLADPLLTTVGFTEYFAHPGLATGGVGSSQGSRTFNRVPRKDIRPAFDLFALGMTIVFLLDRYYSRHSVYQEYAYEIKFLRLCASRLLDGLNHLKNITYGDLPFSAFANVPTSGGLAYKTADELVEDLSKLAGRYALYSLVPELSPTHRETIQVSESSPVAFTPRVRAVVGHALVQRLASVSQLGLLSLVYPGARHTRLEHSLGVMGAAARYIDALHHDTFDPLFRQIVGRKEIKATLLAALFHDIGQYPLAHDLEDVSLSLFGHEAIGRALLTKGEESQRALFADFSATTRQWTTDLSQLLKSKWDVDLEDILSVFSAKSSDTSKVKQTGSHVERLCKSIIDGPIDVDKFDYLQRDARHCHVSYGSGIDVNRLLQTITTVSSEIAKDHLLLVVGVHEKGRISAESLLFARYAMLTQVYWHHTMRAFKAALHHALAEYLAEIDYALESKAREQKLDENATKKFVDSERMKRWGAERRNFIETAIWSTDNAGEDWHSLVDDTNAKHGIDPGDIRVLGWIWSRTTASGREALEHLLARRVFKRILIVYRDDLSEKIRKILEEVFSPESYRDRVELRQQIQSSLLTAARSEAPAKDLLQTQGFTPDEWAKRMQDEDSLKCLLDYPNIRPGSNFGLGVVSEWGDRPRREKAEAPRESYGQLIRSDNFKNGMRELEKSIACLRVFWHPAESRVIDELLGQKRIREIVEGEISRYVPVSHREAA